MEFEDVDILQLFLGKFLVNYSLLDNILVIDKETYNLSDYKSSSHIILKIKDDFNF